PQRRRSRQLDRLGVDRRKESALPDQGVRDDGGGARQRREGEASRVSRRPQGAPRGRHPLQAPGHAAHRRAHHPRPREAGAARAESRARARPLHRAGVRQPRQGVRPRAEHDRILLGRLGVPSDRLVFDVGVASYLLNPGRRSWSVEELALEVLGEQPKPMAGIVEGGADGISIAAAAQAAAQEADLARRLSGPMTTRLREEGLIEIFETMEMPLVEVLADMERAGVKINREILAEMSRDMEKQITDLTRDIHALAGGEL